MATNDCIKGLVVGGLLGLTVGFLYAPKRGKETREDLSQAAESVHSKSKTAI